MSKSRGLALLLVILTGVIIIYPEVSFRASLEGLKLWFEVILPALLPFFIMSDFLMGFGVVHFLGSLLEPVMRPVFKLPGLGGFAVAMGLAAGYPMGAKITGDLVRSKQITTSEGERLVSFANTANPLFLMGAVAVGMFNRPELGVTLVIAHYFAAILVGLCLRFHPGPQSPALKTKEPYLQRALDAMDQARRADGRPIGKLLGDTVRQTFQSMLLIGGCIMLFSVIVQVISATGILSPVQALGARLLSFVGLDASLTSAVITGFFETTMGARTASHALAPLGAQATVTSLVIGWSGLSVHAQVAAMITDTDLSLTPYFFSRLLHGMFAAILTALLLGPASFIPTTISRALPALSTTHYLNGSFAARLLASARLATSFLLILVLILTVLWLLKRIIYISFGSRS